MLPAQEEGQQEDSRGVVDASAAFGLMDRTNMVMSCLREWCRQWKGNWQAVVTVFGAACTIAHISETMKALR